jgi:hypothetical protein
MRMGIFIMGDEAVSICSRSTLGYALTGRR